LAPKWGTAPYHTYYFRTHFTFNGDANAITDFTLKTWLDDGVVVYINGTELTRIHMAQGAVSYSTHTENAYNVGNAVLETWTIAATAALKAALRIGDNVLSAQVHQSNDGSTDIVWGATLDANITTTTRTVTDPVPDRMYDLVAGLRVTELMYMPAGGNNYEYIELKNVSAKTLDLTGVRLSDAVDFTFPGEIHISSMSRQINGTWSREGEHLVGEKGIFLGKHTQPGNYQDQFADLIAGATCVTVSSQPNLERDCKERLPDHLLAYLRKQIG
jgi:hypothetical protein